MNTNVFFNTPPSIYTSVFSCKRQNAMLQEANKIMRMSRSMRPRPPQGQHLTDLRLAAGLTQTGLAELVGESQANIARWETNDRPPRADVAIKLAVALGVSVEDVLNLSKKPGKPGPKGKLARAVEEVSKLPPRQQDQVLQVINALLLQFRQQTR